MESGISRPLLRKGRYCNPHIRDTKRSLFDALLWKTGFYDDREKPEPIPQGFTYPLPKEKFDSSCPSAVWINHSTFLVKVHGLHVLTDPIWSDRCSPFPFLGPLRRHAPAMDLGHLGHLDFVLISHNHYDHLDKKTVLELHRRYPNACWCVPTGVKSWFLRQGISCVEEMGWWEDKTFSLSQDHHLKITSVPSQHFSGRSLQDMNKTLWCGWVFESSMSQNRKRLYFVGDTGYNPIDFCQIGKLWRSMDLSLIPIGSYVPRQFMAPVHIEPKQAVAIHQEVGSKLSLAIHWKTFRLSDELMDQPPYDLYRTLQKEGIDPLSFLAPPPGYEVNW